MEPASAPVHRLNAFPRARFGVPVGATGEEHGRDIGQLGLLDLSGGSTSLALAPLPMPIRLSSDQAGFVANCTRPSRIVVEDVADLRASLADLQQRRPVPGQC